MGLDSVVRSAVALANRVTTSLQGTVQIFRWNGQSQNGGTPTYEATALSVKAIIEPNKVWTKDPKGGAMFLTSRIAILQPIAPLGATGRSEPLDQRDKVVLPDGTTCPIFGIDGGVTDPTTSRPYFFMVTLVR